MLADMLDAPIAKLPVGDNVYACKNFIDAGTLFGETISAAKLGPRVMNAYLIFLEAILKDVLND